MPPIFLTMATSFPFLLFMASSYGLLTGAWIAATSPMLVSLLGINLLPSAFGLMTAGQVIPCLP